MKNLFLIVPIIGLSIAFTSCTKNSVSPAANTSTAKSTSTTNTGSTGSTTPTITPTITDSNLQGNWTVVSDSSFWAGETPKKLVSAYKGKSGDTFNFSKEGTLYLNEGAVSDTVTYTVDNTYHIHVTYTNAKHFNEAPGFGLKLDPVGYNPVVPVSFTQIGTDPNTLILISSIVSPAGAASRIIYLKR